MIDHLVEARQRAEHFRQSLPTSISASSLGVREKAPYKALCIREALIWRTEELARRACDALEQDDLAAGILLTRGVVEGSALIWRVWTLIEGRHNMDGAVLDEHFHKMLVGWKEKETPTFPQALNIMTALGHLEKSVPGVMASYDHLSEFAHPNWNGVAGLFSKIDQEALTTHFGRGLRNLKGNKAMAANLLNASLLLFGEAYNAISDAMPGYLAELSKLDGM